MSINFNQIHSACQFLGIETPTNSEIESGAFEQRITNLALQYLSQLTSRQPEGQQVNRGSVQMTHSEREVLQQEGELPPQPPSTEPTPEPTAQSSAQAKNLPPSSNTNGSSNLPQENGERTALSNSLVLEGAEAQEGLPLNQEGKGLDRQSNELAKNSFSSTSTFQKEGQAKESVQLSQSQETKSVETKTGKALFSQATGTLTLNGRTVSVKVLAQAILKEMASFKLSSLSNSGVTNVNGAKTFAKALALATLILTGPTMAKSSLVQTLALSQGISSADQETLQSLSGKTDGSVKSIENTANSKVTYKEGISSIAAAPNMPANEAIQNNSASKTSNSDEAESQSSEEPLKNTKIAVPYVFIEHLNLEAKKSFESCLGIFEGLGAEIVYINLELISDTTHYSAHERALTSLSNEVTHHDFLIMPTDTRLLEHKGAADQMGLYSSASNFSNLSTLNTIVEQDEKSAPFHIQFIGREKNKKFLLTAQSLFEKGYKTNNVSLQYA